MRHPIDIDSWLKTEFFDNKLNNEDGFICETVYKDNKFIDNAYKNRLESYAVKDYYYYKVYVLNEWGSRATSRIFHNIEIHNFYVPAGGDVPDPKLNQKFEDKLEFISL